MKIEQLFSDEELDFFDDMEKHDPFIVECHFCKGKLHVDNNAMSRCMSGLEVAPRGFSWISVIIEPFNEVPCCDICFEKPNLPGMVMF
jgi:hypothetical protein